jgi:hypothetical protein
VSKDLKIISEEINDLLLKRREELGLTFTEDTHTYVMKNLIGESKSDWPSVSKVIKLFYEEFPAEEISYRMAKGDEKKQKLLLDEWKAAGDYSTNLGSRTHYLLEKISLDLFGVNKEVRQPLFECDSVQIEKSDNMVIAGTNFLNLMKARGAMLLDTEIVLGSNELGYVGQPDKVWLINNKEGNDIGILVTDYKTNKPKNFEETKYTKRMFKPFSDLPDTALGHYSIQLPFYAKLIIDMLKGTKYENIKLLGSIIVLLKEDGEFQEYRINRKIMDTILTMDMKKYLKK